MAKRLEVAWTGLDALTAELEALPKELIEEGNEILLASAQEYERGTKVRTNKAGQNRGRMKRQPTFQPIAAEYQKTALAALIARLYAHGAAQVTAA